MKKTVKIVIAIILIIILAAGGYLMNMFGVLAKGNGSDYSLKNTQSVADSPLKGKTGIFLGSSVTYGYGSLGVSFADFLEKTDGIIAVKEAVSGTTLVDNGKNSYVARMKTINPEIKADFFVCQLSTNDATKNLPLGKISDSLNKEDFDTDTVAGATEYVIAYAKETWNCPIIFYTQAKYDSEVYALMVNMLLELKEKWDITVIDFWNNEEINGITDAERKLYLVDHIHPTKAGYREWWLPEFQKVLGEIV
ncbi:MAG: SGNH/GDSL hydrolase family protein [Clostridia bacterium]|nr:SGNH/GDSL hydrolase family protein [Clostridia bacterium]